MKKVLLLLTLILGINSSYSQNDCSQDDGSFQYRAILTIENVTFDFDKDDFINHITSLDNISNEDLEILNTNITLVFKTLPSVNSHKSVSIVSTIEIFSILEDLNNSVEFHYCVVRDCQNINETFSYYAILTIESIPNDFDKDDFISHIISLDNISNEDLAILGTYITLVYKAFPSAQTELLQRVIVIDATTEIYSILEDLNNSIEFHECNSDGIILNINDNKSTKKSIVYPNPITENSVIKLNMNSSDIKLEVINELGQLLHQEKVLENNIIELKYLPIIDGISFLKIYDLSNGTIETIKIIKEK